MMDRWIVLDVGCIECSMEGSSETELVGVFATEQEAETKAATIPQSGTDHEVIVMRIGEPDTRV